LRIVVGLLLLAGALVAFFAFANAHAIPRAPDFDQPSAITSDGTRVWVADYADDSVTEINASTGAVVRVINLDNPSKPPVYGPWSIGSNGRFVWVSYADYSKLTQLNAMTGVLVQTIPTSTSPGIGSNIAVDGDRLWVPNLVNSPLAASSVTEFNADTGAIIRIRSMRHTQILPFRVAADSSFFWVNGSDEFNAKTGALVRRFGESDACLHGNGPYTETDDGVHLWEAIGSGNCVAEVDDHTGKVVRVIAGRRYDSSNLLAGPQAIASDGVHVWVRNVADNTVAELNAMTGALIQVLRGPSFDFDFDSRSANSTLAIESLSGVSSDGDHVWIANVGGDSVTELDARTGALIQVIR
jgi:DNA-binding beta-propeller fold protein YncE